VIYAAAGGSGKGLFEAATEAGKPGDVWAIGVDSDQYLSVDPAQQPYILTSALKRVDVGTYDAIAAELDGSFKSETIVYDLASGGIGYSASNPAIDDYAGTIEEAKAAIIDGSITVPG
jgi:basic membrane protein A